jgi:DNA-binding transcriptional LysR family regulator
LAQALISHEIDLALDVVQRESEEISPIADCRWHDRSYVVAALTHPLRSKRRLKLADTMDQQWAVPPRGTGPFEHMQQVFAAHGLGLPNVVVETRSITALKSLITRAGFLSWMAEPIYDAERTAKLIDKLPVPGVVATRTLTAFRRRQGILPGPAVKLLEELRQIAAEP